MAASTRTWAPLLALALAVGTAMPASAQGDVPADADKAYSFAIENFDLGDVAAARDQLQEALRALDRAGLADDAAAIPTRLLLGIAHARLGADADARAQFEAARTVRRSTRRGDGA